MDFGLRERSAVSAFCCCFAVSITLASSSGTVAVDAAVRPLCPPDVCQIQWLPECALDRPNEDVELGLPFQARWVTDEQNNDALSMMWVHCTRADGSLLQYCLTQSAIAAVVEDIPLQIRSNENPSTVAAAGMAQSIKHYPVQGF